MTYREDLYESIRDLPREQQKDTIWGEFVSMQHDKAFDKILVDGRKTFDYALDCILDEHMSSPMAYLSGTMCGYLREKTFWEAFINKNGPRRTDG